MKKLKIFSKNFTFTYYIAPQRCLISIELCLCSKSQINTITQGRRIVSPFVGEMKKGRSNVQSALFILCINAMKITNRLSWPICSHVFSLLFCGFCERMVCGRYAFLFSPSTVRSRAEESKLFEEIKHQRDSKLWKVCRIKIQMKKILRHIWDWNGILTLW